jgi:hypothetical protein
MKHLVQKQNIQESHLALEHIFCMLVECHYFSPTNTSTPQIP